MKLHDLHPRKGSRRNRKRVGRGISAGQGKTAGRGTKGYGARAGKGGKLHFQGGNLPFYRRLPFKRGFTNPFRRSWNEVNVDQLEGVKEGTKISPELLAETGLLMNPSDPIVLLGRGEIKTAVNVEVHRATQAAIKKIEKAGGKVKLLPLGDEAEQNWNTVEIGKLGSFEEGTTISPESLAEAGLVPDAEAPVELRGRGAMKNSLQIQVHRVSHSARKKIRAAGGSVKLLEIK